MPSRVGKMPIKIPQGVQVKREAQAIHVKGPKGELEFRLAHGVEVKLEPNEILVAQVGGGKQALALHGTTGSRRGSPRRSRSRARDTAPR